MAAPADSRTRQLGHALASGASASDGNRLPELSLINRPAAAGERETMNTKLSKPRPVRGALYALLSLTAPLAALAAGPADFVVNVQVALSLMPPKVAPLESSSTPGSILT